MITVEKAILIRTISEICLRTVWRVARSVYERKKERFYLKKIVKSTVKKT